MTRRELGVERAGFLRRQQPKLPRLPVAEQAPHPIHRIPDGSRLVPFCSQMELVRLDRLLGGDAGFEPKLSLGVADDGERFSFCLKEATSSLACR